MSSPGPEHPPAAVPEPPPESTSPAPSAAAEPDSPRVHPGPEPVEVHPGPEPVKIRRARHRRRFGLYVQAFLMVALIVVVAALAVANTRRVELDWLFGVGHAPLVWIVIATAVVGWVLGILTAVLLRRRTRPAVRP
jgi:uncharacterized integral membrane protein